MSSVAPSSTTSSLGRLFAFAGGGFMLLVAAMMFAGAAMNGWHKHVIARDWPVAHAVVHNCAVGIVHRGARTRTAVRAVCAISFTDPAGQPVTGGFESLPALDEHRRLWWASNPSVDDLRVWVARHPPGTAIDVRYDPTAPAGTVPVGSPEIFDEYPTRGFLRNGCIAALIGLLVIAAAMLFGR